LQGRVSGDAGFLGGTEELRDLGIGCRQVVVEGLDLGRAADDGGNLIASEIGHVISVIRMG
jgi:hypothetical protein